MNCKNSVRKKETELLLISVRRRKKIYFLLVLFVTVLNILLYF